MPAPILNVPTPCHEDWQQMMPTGPGRHCAACQKVVVDFTRFTDTELLLYLQQQAGQATCGRFRAEQLERPLQPLAVAGAARWRAWLVAAVAVWGLREASAPAARAQAPVEQQVYSPKSVAITVGIIAEPPVVVRGTVTDSQGPIPGVTVLLTGTEIMVYSDANGTFELAVPPIYVTLHKELTISSIGFETRQIALPPFSTQPIDITLVPRTLGEPCIVIAGGVYVRPWYTPHSLWLRLKRPFRRW